MKLCYDCEHILVNAGWGGSDVTPGEHAELRCGKGYWNVFNRMYSGGGPELKDALLRAETCPDFTPAEYVNEP